MHDPRTVRRYGNNNPIYRQQAGWDGHRSIRLVEDNVGLATTAYSYGLGYDEVTEVAERLALLWNLHLDNSTEELRRLIPPSTREVGDA